MRSSAVVLALLASTGGQEAATTSRHVWVGDAPPAADLKLPIEQLYSSLADAVGAAATVSAATTIHLASGRHALSAPLVLDHRHSGSRFVGHGDATVTGGVQVGGPAPPGAAAKNISGWAHAGPAACAGCGANIWKAPTPKGVDSRQFYVNGVRANRTWAPFPVGGHHPPTAATIAVAGTKLQGVSPESNLPLLCDFCPGYSSTD